MPTRKKKNAELGEIQRKFNRAVARLNKYKTSKGVAKFLEREGITGRRGRPWSCPIANYLIRETGATFAKSTGDFVSVEHFFDPPLNSGETRSILFGALGEGAYRFVFDFDSGMYPNLVDRSK